MQKVMLMAVCLLLAGTAAHSQQRTALDSVVQAMARHNVYEKSLTVGYAGSLSTQYLHFERLLALAAHQQLAELAARHPNGVVRLYAYRALQWKKATLAPELVQQFRNDTTKVQTLSGCQGAEETLSALVQQDQPFALQLQLTLSQNHL